MSESGVQIKIRIFGILFVLGFMLIVGRAVHLQVVLAPALQERADQQRQQVIQLAPQRGSIFDRNGDPLAVSLVADSLYADPARIKDPAEVAKQISPLLELSRNEIKRLLSSRKRFVWLQRKMDPKVAQEIRKKNSWIELCH